MIIAIDGPAGSGKTTTAKNVAKRLKITYINTGAMYRSVALKFIYEEIDLADNALIGRILKNTRIKFSNDGNILYLDDEDVSNEIKSTKVTEKVSKISSIFAVREKMVECQRKLASCKDVVLEGRDIGTVVFPQADYKFFLIADINERAKRRRIEMEMMGEQISIDETIKMLNERDANDSLRKLSPLLKAEDAIVIDTTNITIEEQVNKIVSIVK